MKKTSIQKRAFSMVALVFMLVAQLATAQDVSAIQHKTPEERAQMQTKIMKSKLSLDSLQATKVQAINLKYALKTDPILKSDAGKFKKLKKIKALQEEKDDELKQVLTADQFKQYQALKERLKEKIKERKQ
jgi:hypothetical protein